MRQILLLAVVYGSLPVVLVRPFVGLLVYSWVAYMRPHDLAWGLREIPISQHVMIATMVGLLLALRRERFVTLAPQMILLAALLCWSGVTVVTAIDPELAQPRLIMLAKVALFSAITTGLVRSQRRFRLLVFVVAFSLGLLGLKYALYGILAGGVSFQSGPGGFMMDNNDFAMALNMAIPLLVGIAVVERNHWLRLFAMACVAAGMITVVLTFSRGGLLCLLVLLVLVPWRLGHARGAVAIVLLAASMAPLLVTTDIGDQYRGRAGSISSYKEDPSAMGRIESWKTAARISKDYPFVGVGPDNLRLIYRRYSSNLGQFLVSHNTFLQILVDSGWPALCLFVAMLLVSLWRLERLRDKNHESWVRTNASVLQVSFAVFIVGGMFLNRAYFDLFYHFVALGVSLEIAAQKGSEAMDEEPRSRETIPEQWWQKPRLPGRTTLKPHHSG